MLIKQFLLYQDTLHLSLLTKYFIFVLTARESKYRGKKCKIIGTIPKHSKN